MSVLQFHYEEELKWVRVKRGFVNAIEQQNVRTLVSSFVGGGDFMTPEALSVMLKVVLNPDIQSVMKLKQKDVLNVVATCKYCRESFGKHSSRVFEKMNPDYAGKTGEFVLTDRLLKRDTKYAKHVTKEVASIRGKIKRRENQLEILKKELRDFQKEIAQGCVSGTSQSIKGKIKTRKNRIDIVEEDVGKLRSDLEEELAFREELKTEIIEIKKKKQKL